MMRVLMTTDVVGGVWTYSLELLGALAPRGVQVDLAVLGPGVEDAHVEEAYARGAGAVYVLPGALEWMPDPWTDVDRTGRQLLALAREIEPDVVHLGGYAHAALPWPAPTVVVAHSCVASWWQAVHGEPAPWQWDEYRTRVGNGLRAAGAVVAPTAAMLHDLQRHHGIGQDGTVIPKGRSAHWVTERDKQPMVLAAGRVWDEAKNLVRLAAATGDLPWPVVIAGQTTSPDGTDVTKQAPANVCFPGALSFAALGELMSRASIFAAPALYEPFGLGPLEAAQAGCALLLSDIPSLREVWGDAAWFVDPTDPSSLRAGLQALITDDALRAELGDRARARAEQYTPERMAATYLYLYRDLAVRQPVGVG